jgi:hypothetical protein
MVCGRTVAQEGELKLRGARGFVVFTTSASVMGLARYYTLDLNRSIHSPLHPTAIMSILILSSHPYIYHSSQIF